MRKYSILFLSLVLTACLFTGCRSKKPDMTPTSMPTTAPTTQATTAPTTAPTMAPTTPSTETQETIDHGNGPREESTATDGSEETGGASRSRGAMPNMK